MSDKLFRISTPTIKYTIDDEFDMSRVASSRFIICNMGNKNLIVKENPVIEDMSFKVNLTQEDTKKLNAGIISAQIHILLNNHKVIWTDVAKTTMNGVLGEDMFDVPDYSADTGEYEIDFHGTVSDYDVPLHGHLDVTLEGSTVIPNPEGEATDDLTKVEIDGEIFLVKDSTIHDWARAEEKPSYTKAEVGLANVDNTSDLNKPVSTATQVALDLKADSSSVYTKTESDNLLNGKADKSDTYTKSEVDSALADKVDKVEGYGLSKNNYTDEEKAKVGEIDNKLDKTETAVNSNGLVIATPVTDTAPYIYRQTPVKESFKALMKKIVGASVVWNQMWEKPSVSQPSRNSSTITVENEIITITPNSYTSNSGGIYRNNMVYGHKVLLIADLYADGETSLQVEFGRASQKNITISTKTWTTVFSITYNSTNQTGNASCNIYMRCGASTWESGTLKVKNVVEVDLTTMFGSTIADYVHTLETSRSGSGIAWLQSYGFFTEDYYAYKQNKLESGCVSAHKTYDGETLLTNTELSPITLRGLFKLSTDKLTVDGDEYNADGSVTRKYGIVDLGNTSWTYDSTNEVFFPSSSSFDIGRKTYTGTSTIPDFVCSKYVTGTNANGADGATSKPDKTIFAKNGDSQLLFIKDSSYTDGQTFTNAMSGVYLIYELATPTTEQTTPFTETEIVGSTEEFIDYEVAQGNRDVAIPVGTETDYYQEMKLPSLPTTSGNHNLIYNIATGFGWS